MLDIFPCTFDIPKKIVTFNSYYLSKIKERVQKWKLSAMALALFLSLYRDQIIRKRMQEQKEDGQDD